jgi:hypothetical protein
MFRYLTSLSALVASIIIPASAHTWIEEYQVIGPNGSYIGDRGYSRGYIGREDPTFDASFNSLWLLPPSDAVMPDGTVRLRVNSTDNVCRNSQQTRNYTNPAYPMLKAAPGDYVAMKYLENGHVTLPWNQPGKPPQGGTVYVFGTTDAIEDEKLVDVMKWTENGSGGNGRGRLLATQNFDDGRCHQLNDCSNSVERQAAFPNPIPGQPDSVSELWCETDVKLPEDLKSGIYTTYWVWQWPTEPCKECAYPEGKDEWYTTCADHQIIAPGPDDEVKLADAPATNTLPMEDNTRIAVATYKQRKAFTTHPVILDNWANYNVRVATTTDAKVASFATSCATVVVPTGVPPACPAGKWATGTLAAFYSSKGLASLKLAQAEWKTITEAAPTSAPAVSSSAAPSPTRRPAADGSPSIKVTRVKSVITTYYTTTVTMSPTHRAGGDRPHPTPHQGSPDRASPDGGFPTVTTEGAPRPTGKPVEGRKHARQFGV